ncbi:phosphoribosylglycinamide formyltransferase [Chromobacterium sp. TRC.1.1.SA]|uniref:Phosphoribosylglycinamide formyltransferase n=1 Tax=Chromobacterium indicum TaxID=3110228 RepID=A0ABV0CEW2_9NEIS
MTKDIAALIAPILAAGGALRTGRKHPVLIMPNGRRTGIPVNPSDRRALQNLRSHLKRLQPDLYA